MSDRTQTIDRMVDGELSRDDEREMLLHCEANNGWRELALAFVESRAFQQEMESLRSLAPETSEQETIVRQATPVGQESWNIWSLAAAVLLSLGLGYGLGLGWQGTTPTGMDYAASAPDRQAEELGAPDSMQFMVNHPRTRELQQVEIPLLKATDLGPDWQQRLQANSWDGVVDDMRRQGLNLRQERTLTPVRLSNGQRVVVPVDYFYEQPYQ